MSQISIKHSEVQQPQTSRTTIIVITVVLALVAFVVSPNGPLGGFWRPAPLESVPSGVQIALFIFVNLVEVITFGLGICFLLFGYRTVKAALPGTPTLATVSWLALSWTLINWWPHDSLHMYIGTNVKGLLALELGFHVTLMISGLILAYMFVQMFRRRTGENAN